MKNKIYQLIAVLFLSSISVQLFAITRSVPATYPTIQSALNACLPGDTVLVQPGTYTENLTWPWGINNIKMISSGGPAVTIVSANNSGRVLILDSPDLDTNSVISGFTFTAGNITSGSGYGAGVYVANCGVVLDSVYITGNRVNVPGGHGYGAGLYFMNSTSLIRNSRISGNSIDTATWAYGGGVYVAGGVVSFSNVTIANNSSRAENWCYGVGLYSRNGTLLNLNEVKVTGNNSGDNAIWYYGNGIYLDDANASLVNVLIASNKSGAGGSFNYGGGIYCDGTSVVSMNNVTVTDNSKTGNASINGSGVYARDASVTIVNSILYNVNSGIETGSGGSGSIGISYSNVRGGAAGTGNMNVIPGFISPTDFHLHYTSPCVNASIASVAPPIDLDGNIRPLPALTLPDLGCYEVDQSITALNEMNEPASKIFVYPNPVMRGNEVSVGEIFETLYITDLSGRIVNTLNPEQILKIKTDHLKAGVYFISTGNKLPVKLVVIE